MRTRELFSWYSSEHSSPMIEPPSCRQYKPADFLHVRPLNCDDIINVNDTDDNWADPVGASARLICAGDSSDNDDSDGEEDTQSCDKGIGKEKGTKDGKRTEKVTEDGKGK
jgi:hypothetical protein